MESKPTPPYKLSSWKPSSPNWGPTTKLIVGLTIVALVAALLIQFRGIIGPILVAFILAYILFPVAKRMQDHSAISWRMAVNLIYLVLLILLIGLFTLTGFALVQQIISLIATIQKFVADLPRIASELSAQVYTLGPFTLDLSQFELQAFTDQIINIVRPILVEITGLVSTIATGTLATLGWVLFTLLVSYFLLADGGGLSNRVENVNLPGYGEDIRQLSLRLKVIWNSFLRGQIIIILLVVVTYWILMVMLGVRYSLAIALLAGLARFVPYVGPFTAWAVLGLVSFFQGGNYFHLEPYQYTLLTVAVALVADQIFDHLVTPRFMGTTLGVHPAAVLVAALVAANLLGLVGVILAAPVLATLQVIGRYVIRKMFDLPPWEEVSQPEEITMPWTLWLERVRGWRGSKRL
jgi:predicted PurR-regulated permease PerM